MAPGKGRVMREGRRGRVIVRVLVFGVVGVVLSLASALPVLWVEEVSSSHLRRTRHSESHPGVQVFGRRLGVRMFLTGMWSTAFTSDDKISWLQLWWVDAETDPSRHGYYRVEEFAAGLPLPVMSSGTHTIINEDGTLSSYEWGRELKSRERRQRVVWQQGIETVVGENLVIPTRVIWRGLIGNTVFYGVIAWIIIALLGWWRRAIRRRRGLCEWCGYSMEGLEDAARCPECGGERRGGVMVAPSAPSASP